MHLSWTDVQRKAYDEMLAAASQRLGAVTPYDREQPWFTRAEWRACGELGLLGLAVPESHGGGGLGALETAHLLEAFGRACPDTGLVFAAGAHLLACAMPIATFASDEVRDRLLPGMCAGELVAANAMTEDDAGSDVGRLSTVATRVDGGWLLRGEKSFASNAPVADVIVTYATTDPAAGFLGVTGFVVERDRPGVRVGEPFAKMGLDGCPAGRVAFDGVLVPDSHVLGQPGQGGAIFQSSMGWERACLLAGWLGVMDRLVADAVAHARSRRQFGRRIGDFQAVSHRIAGMAVRAETAKLMLYRACHLMDQGADATTAIAMAKLVVSEAAVATALDAVQVLGARGYQRAGAVEAALRDSVPTTLFSGTSEIQRELVAEGLGL
ncbi:MAG: acyl-CoA dehydrogenase family protein [Frankiaceae bacterium]